MPYQISDLAQATDVTASLASREIELGGLGLGAFRLSLANLRKALLLGAVSLGFNATDPLTVGATTVTTLQTSGIAGFGQAPEANNAVAVRGATSDNTSNIFLGRNAAAVVKFAIDSTGLITTFGGLTVSSGATSLQAVTATSVTSSGLITSTIAGSAQIFNAASGGLGFQYFNIQTTNGRAVFGVVANDGTFGTGTTANAAVFGSFVSAPVDFITNATRRGGFNAAGAFDVNNGFTVSAGGLTVTGTGLFNGDVKAHNVGILGSGGDYGSIGYGSTSTVVGTVYTYASNDFASRIEFTSGGFKFFTAPVGTVGNNITFTQRGWMTQDGIFMWGTSVSSGAALGSIVLPNSIFYSAANVAGTAVLGLLGLNASNLTSLQLNSVALALINPSTAASATSGAASALPANPLGYLNMNINGVASKIPYYNN